MERLEQKWKDAIGSRDMEYASGITQDLIGRAVDFHGHWCGGLATGVRVAAWAMENFGTAADEEIVAVAECDMCAIDAIQALVGCTMGKGNLILRDCGKVAFTFYRRRDRKALRVAERFDPDDPLNMRMLQIRRELMSQNISEWIRTRFEVELSGLRKKKLEHTLSAEFGELFRVMEPNVPVPPFAKRLPSVPCEECGEGVMSSKIVTIGGRKLCMDCAERFKNAGTA